MQHFEIMNITDNGISKEGKKILREAIQSNSLLHGLKLISK